MVYLSRIGFFFILSAAVFIVCRKGLLDDFRILLLAGAGCILIFLAIILRRISVCFLKSRAVYSPEGILNKKKPFYTDKATWDCIRKQAFRQKKEHDKFQDCIDRVRLHSLHDNNFGYLNRDKLKSLISKALEL